jgi:low affinity Fe/Cu permease
MRLWIGILTFLAGAMLWYVAVRDKAWVPAQYARLGLGVAALGLGTLASTQLAFGLEWSLSSIAFGIIAIVLIGSFVLQNLRR